MQSLLLFVFVAALAVGAYYITGLSKLQANMAVQESQAGPIDNSTITAMITASFR